LGDRAGQRSIRLNKQFLLVFTIHTTDDGSLAWIIEVVDYHQRCIIMKFLKNAVSGLPIHPGLTLRDELAERGITQTAFAKQIGRPIQMVNEIIKGKESITADTAVDFEKALGIRAELWLKMEASYQVSSARASLRKAPRRRAKVAV
jgi:addiction module HigA family antidote